MEQAKISQQLIEQKHQLEVVQRQIEAKAEEVKLAKQAGKIQEAKKLNEEYNELRKKQAAVTAFIVNLEENAAYRTFVQFQSLEELYNPNTNLTASQVTITTIEPTFLEKATPYLYWGGFSLLLVGIIYLGYRFFFKET
ncbi:MAG: hypothetical protein mread185_000307 [Mycoplasmataceae bacterium]|nr:MAG: hypothetical protein mread185_000307 [Mycoplasmataceae bacterium]